MSKPVERNRLNEDHGRKLSSSLANGMENHHPVCSSGEKRSHHWRSYKLIIDPALKRGQHKLYRYDGTTFNMPNPGMPPVDIVRDPRIGRLWTKYKETDLPVPKFKIDECYIGRVPPKEVTFARLNDNIREGFLTDMCKKFGDIEEVEILYNPKNKKHLGIAKVVFGTVKSAKDAVQTLHNTSVMGNFIHVELDPKGENRLKYFQLLLNGSFTPRTLPVGGEDAREVSPHSLAMALMACESTRRPSESSLSVAAGGMVTPSSTGTNTTPLSQDTAYSSLKQDTPQSQGTPRQSGTPFSQDSNYSSRQGTPAYQSSRAESSGGYKTRRHESKFQDAYNRRPERRYVHGSGGSGTSSSTSSSSYRGNSEQPAFKQHQAATPEPPPAAPSFAHTPPPASFVSAFSPYQQAPMPPAFPPAVPPFHPPVQREPEYRRPPQPPPAPAPDFMPVKDKPGTPPIPEPPPEPKAQPSTPPARTPEHCPPSPGTPTLESERNSLDSRIEMLLKEKRTKLPFLPGGDSSDTEVRMECSPISSSSSQLSPIPPYGDTHTSRPSSTGLEDVSPTPLPDSDDDEPIPGTGSLLKRVTSPDRIHGKNTGDLKEGHLGNHTPTDKIESHQSSGEDMEISDEEDPPGTPTHSGDCAKGIVVNSAVSPMPPIPVPPPGFPPLPPQAGFGLPHHLSAVPGPHPHLAPGVPHPMLPHLYPPGMVPMMQMDLMSCLPQWGSVHMSFQMQTQMLSRMAQTRGPYPYPHFMAAGGAAAAGSAAMPFVGPYPPLSMSSTPAAGAAGHGQQPWPHPSMPKFNPAVPPPGYEAKKEDPHKATVDGVLLVIVKELKAIMKRDLNRKMVEVVAFRAFDEWWDKKEHSAKTSLTPVKTGEGKEEEKEKPKPKETMGSSLLENWNKGEGLGYEGMGLGIGLRGAIRLPSFKVKRKDPPDATSTGDTKRARPSTPADDELEETAHEDGSRADEDSAVPRRRPSRPLELDSEGEEEVETSGKEESLSDREEEPDETEASERLSSSKDTEEEEEEDEDEAASSSDGESSESSDEDVASSASSKDSDSSASGDSSAYESSSEEEEEEEEVEEEEESVDVESLPDKDEERVRTSSSSSSSSSSSEDEVEVEPKAPSTPPGPPPDDEPSELAGAEDQSPREGLKLNHRAISEEEAVEPGPTCLEDLRPPSPKGVPAEEPDIDLEVVVPVLKMELQDDVTNLRPPTPTGSLADSDQDTQPKPHPEELPCTPGRGAPTSLEPEPALPKSLVVPPMHLPHPPNPTMGGHSLLLPPTGPLPDLPLPFRARLSTDEDLPRTPGRDLMDRAKSMGRSQNSTENIPVTPGGDAPLTGSSLASLSSPHISGSPFSYPAQSPVLSAGIPRTPGRDLTFTPVFPDPHTLDAGLPLHRKDSPLFKEPLLSTLSNQTQSLICLQIDTLHSMPTDLPAVPALELPVPPDATPPKRRPGRPKSKKALPAVTSPKTESVELSVSSVTMPPSLPQDAQLTELSANMAASATLPDLPSRSGLDSSMTVLDVREGEMEAQTVIPPDDHFLSYEDDESMPKPPRKVRRGWEELLLASHSPVTTPPRPHYGPRSEFEEMTILYDIWNDGIDEEDIRHLQVTYDKMLQQDNGNDWLNDTLWVQHPPTNIPAVKRKKRDDGMRDHMTGCARSEGYYKIDKKDKIKYLNSNKHLLEEGPVDMQGMSIPAQPLVSTRAGSERRSEQRRLQSSFNSDSDLLKFNQLKFRKKKIRFCKSHIHDWGLFAMEPIAADEMVIEYVGQNIRQMIADMREKRYEDEGIGSSYMFRVDHDTIIDATKCGNFARFINHSCNPNCYAKVITVESQKKIVIYSRQPINVNEEITYDYKFPIEDEKIPCLCGAENCRGTLN